MGMAVAFVFAKEEDCRYDKQEGYRFKASDAGLAGQINR